MGFPRQEDWSGLPFPSPGDLPHPGLEPGSPALQEDSLPSEPPGKSLGFHALMQTSPWGQDLWLAPNHLNMAKVTGGICLHCVIMLYNSVTSFLALKKWGTTLGAAYGKHWTECSPQLTAVRHWGPPYDSLQGTECFQQPEELRHGSLPSRASDKTWDLANAFFAALQKTHQRTAWTPDPGNCEIINMCCFKLLRLW